MYRTVPCPDAMCKQQVLFRDLLGHMKYGKNPWGTSPLSMHFNTKMRNYEGKYDCGFSCMILKFKDKLFAAALRRVDGLWYSYVYFLGDPEELKMFSVKMSIGEGTQTSIIHSGQVFPVDADKAEILREDSGVLSFSSVGMGKNFFQDKDYDGEKKKLVIITYEIIEVLDN